MVVVDIDHGHGDRIPGLRIAVGADQQAVVAAELPGPLTVVVAGELMPLTQRVDGGQLAHRVGCAKSVNPETESVGDVPAFLPHLPLVRAQFFELSILIQHFQQCHRFRYSLTRTADSLCLT